MENEIWKKIQGYENYSVSNLGRIRNDNTNKCICCKGDKDGYIRVGLTKDGNLKTYKIHRLVAMAFIPNPSNKPCIDHIDGNKANNRVENLRWATYKENNNNPITKERMGIAKRGFKHTEENRLRMCETQRKLWNELSDSEKKKRLDRLHKLQEEFKIKTYVYNLDGSLVNIYDSISDAANDLKLSTSTISTAIRGNNLNSYVINKYIPSDKPLTKDEVLERYNHYLLKMEESRQRTIEASKKEVCKYTLTGELVGRYKGITVAAESVNGFRQSVGNACYHRLGRKKTNVYKGYIWRFAND